MLRRNNAACSAMSAYMQLLHQLAFHARVSIGFFLQALQVLILKSASCWDYKQIALGSLHDGTR